MLSRYGQPRRATSPLPASSSRVLPRSPSTPCSPLRRSAAAAAELPDRAARRAQARPGRRRSSHFPRRRQMERTAKGTFSVRRLRPERSRPRRPIPSVARRLRRASCMRPCGGHSRHGWPRPADLPPPSRATRTSATPGPAIRLVIAVELRSPSVSVDCPVVVSMQDEPVGSAPIAAPTLRIDDHRPARRQLEASVEAQRHSGRRGAAGRGVEHEDSGPGCSPDSPARAWLSAAPQPAPSAGRDSAAARHVAPCHLDSASSPGAQKARRRRPCRRPAVGTSRRRAVDARSWPSVSTRQAARSAASASPIVVKRRAERPGEPCLARFHLPDRLTTKAAQSRRSGVELWGQSAPCPRSLRGGGGGGRAR